MGLVPFFMPNKNSRAIKMNPLNPKMNDKIYNTIEKTNPVPIVLMIVGYDSAQYRGYKAKLTATNILIKQDRTRIIISKNINFRKPFWQKSQSVSISMES